MGGFFLAAGLRKQVIKLYVACDVLRDCCSSDSAEVHMSRLTVFLARSIGLFTILLVAGFLVRGGAVIESTVTDTPVMLSYAIISLAMGVAMVVGHTVWSGGALPVVVTLVGWLILAKGIFLLVFSPEAFSGMMHRMHYGEHYSLYLAPAFVLGLYLTWAGFAAPFAREY
jgi:hypothetical protein